PRFTPPATSPARRVRVNVTKSRAPRIPPNHTPRYVARCGGDQNPSTPMLDSQEKSQIRLSGVSLAAITAPEKTIVRIIAFGVADGSSRERGLEDAMPFISSPARNLARTAGRSPYSCRTGQDINAGAPFRQPPPERGLQSAAVHEISQGSGLFSAPFTFVACCALKSALGSNVGASVNPPEKICARGGRGTTLRSPVGEMAEWFKAHAWRA